MLPTEEAAHLLLNALLAGLICFRLAQFAVYDDGPFAFMARVRHWSRRQAHRRGTGRLVRTTNAIMQQISAALGVKGDGCPYCVGMWLSLAAAVVLARERPFLILPLALAIAGVQAFMESRQ